MGLNLVIGCGGSGLVTIRELNRLLAQDPAMLPRIPNEVFYLVLDTKKKDLEDFEAALEEQMGAYEKPYTESVQLSRGLSILSDAFRVPFKARYEGVKGDSGQARLKEHWWFQASGEPFLAPEVGNLIDGAGQCPPASYGLTWFWLREIGEAVKRIVDEMVKRGNGDRERLKSLKWTVVSGLAGGTGRGSWSLVTFKVREYLLDNYDVKVAPIGVFFDANAFEKVAEDHPGQATALKVNSLTGLSELSCWLKNGGKSRDERYAYRLPSIETPDRRATDVLKVDLDLNPKSGTNVGTAFLVCGASPSAKLDTNEQYHAMAGAGLYAMMMNEDIAGVIVNDSEAYRSMAAATFEVDALHIRKYFETHVRGLALAGLATGTDGAREAAEAFLKNCPLAAVAGSDSDLKPDPRGTLYQRAAKALLGMSPYKEAFGNIRDDLKEWTEEEALEALEDLVEPKAAAASACEAVQEALRGMGTGLDGEKAAEAVAEAAKAVYRGQGGQKPSLARTRAFLEAVRSIVAAARKNAPQSLKANPETGTAGTPGEVLRSVLHERGKRTAREVLTAFPGLGPKVGAYNDEDIGKLFQDDGCWGDVPRAVLAAAYPALKAAVEGAFAAAMDRVEKLIAGCKRFEDCCAVAKRTFDREEGKAAGGKRGDKAFQLLFATPDRVEDTLCKTGETERFYHRKLIPIVESEAELAGMVGGSSLASAGLVRFISKAVDDGTIEALGEERNDELREQFTRKLTDTVRKNVSLAEGFMEEHFAFNKVLAGNLRHWNRAIADARGDEARTQRLTEMFQRTIGAKPSIDKENPDAGPKLPEEEYVRLSIATSLAATCSPWWNADTKDAAHKTTVFVPFGMNSALEERRKKVQKEIAEHAEFTAHGLGAGGGTPYAYVAFVWAGLKLTEDEKRRGMHLLDKVKSLTHYREPEVMQWLRMAESQDGESIFSTSNGNKGIGYVSPIYVRDATLSSFRWKPWMRDDETLEEERENEAVDLMLYAMLGLGLDEDRRKAFNARLAVYGMRLPLLQLSETGQVWSLARRTLRWSDEDRQAIDNTDCEGSEGRRICTSVCNLDTLLRGKGKTGKDGELKPADVADGLKFKELVEIEARMFEEHVLPELVRDYRELVQARTRWLVAQRDGADPKDKAVFNRLLARSERR